MAAQSLQPFQWGDIDLSQVVCISGMPHATRTTIGEWLEYADPRDAINKIIERPCSLAAWPMPDLTLLGKDLKQPGLGV